MDFKTLNVTVQILFGHNLGITTPKELAYYKSC